MLFRVSEHQLEPVLMTTVRDLHWDEKQLENVLAGHIGRSLSSMNLMPIFQERRRQPEPDILALSEDGVLYVFELKVDAAGEDAVAQVLRYTQRYGRYGYEKLQDLFRQHEPEEATEASSLQEAHRDWFELEEPVPIHDFNREQHSIIVARGSDRAAFQAVWFWKRRGLDIDVLPYRVFRLGSESYIEIMGLHNDYFELPPSEQYAAWINTCRAFLPDGGRHMLTHDRASAWGDRRSLMRSLRRGVRLFLYHNQVGIVASGTVRNGRLNENDVDDETWVALRMDKKLNPLQNLDAQRAQALSAAEVRQILGREPFWRQALVTLSRDEGRQLHQAFLRK